MYEWGWGVVHSFSRAGSLGSGFYELSVSRVSKRRGRGGHVGRAFTGLATRAEEEGCSGKAVLGV